jgi:CheY-like chemotaxis protein
MAVLLIADDDADLRAVFSALFTRRGFTVFTAPDGDHALRLARQHRPDVVLTDYDMPGMDGLQLCRALRDDPRLRTVPVALLSGSLASGDPRTEGLALCRLLSKPLSNADLVAAVQRLVDRGGHEHAADSAHCLPAA